MVVAIAHVISTGLKEGNIQIQRSFGEEAGESLRRWRKITGPKEAAAEG